MSNQYNNVLSASDRLSGTRNWTLVVEFLDHLRRAGMAESTIRQFPGPAKHFLMWLGAQRINPSDIDVNTVQRFLAHDCACPRPRGERYQNAIMNTRGFRTRVLRFVQFLEQSDRIPNPVSLDEGLQRIAEFTAFLKDQGYASGTIKVYDSNCRHFVTWLHQNRIALTAIDNGIVSRFATHDCICPGTFVQNAQRNSDYLFKVQRFVGFLGTIGVIPPAVTTTHSEPNNLLVFRDWLRRHRGTGEYTIRDHVRVITKLLPQLGDDPDRYDGALINRVILQNLDHISRVSAKRMCVSLRMYLRFLAATGACSPRLIGAVPRIPNWRLATLPRYILKEEVERVITSCDPTTPRGLRDRAILLLLARLALRGGDIANLHLEDIDWDNALIRVAGKTRHEVALPLPQDAGDALLAYIERVRPVVDSSKIFIRGIAPFVPLSSSSAISTVVRRALERAGVDNANLRGAYLLRHSAATNMLRSGATLDAVSAVLRHRSPQTTTIYAKVDTAMLNHVVESWIGGAPCR